MDMKWMMLVLIGAALMTNTGQIKEGVQDVQVEKEERSDFSESIRNERIEARRIERQAEVDSKTAMARINSGFYPVVEYETLVQTGEWVEVPFTEEMHVAIALGGRTDQPLQVGSIVANRLGDTGVIEADGTVGDIAKVAPAELAAYQQIYDNVMKTTYGQ